MDTAITAAKLFGLLAHAARRNNSPVPHVLGYYADTDDSAAAPTFFNRGGAATSVVTNTGSWTVKNHTMRLGSPLASGATVGYHVTDDLGAPVTNVGARFMFVPGATAYTNSVASIGIANGVVDVANLPSMPAFLHVTPTTWTLSIWAGVDHGSAGETVLASGNLLAGGLVPGVFYEMEVHVNPSLGQIWAKLPDGRTIAGITNSLITTYSGDRAFWKAGVTAATDGLVAFTHQWADTDFVRSENAAGADIVNLATLGVTAPRQDLAAATTHLLTLPVAAASMYVGQRWRAALNLSTTGTSVSTIATRLGTAGDNTDTALASPAFTALTGGDTVKVDIDIQVDAVTAGSAAITVFTRIAANTSTVGVGNAVTQATSLTLPTAGFLGVSIAETATGITLLGAVLEQVA